MMCLKYTLFESLLSQNTEENVLEVRRSLCCGLTSVTTVGGTVAASFICIYRKKATRFQKNESKLTLMCPKPSDLLH